MTGESGTSSTLVQSDSMHVIEFLVFRDPTCKRTATACSLRTSHQPRLVMRLSCKWQWSNVSCLHLRRSSPVSWKSQRFPFIVQEISQNPMLKHSASIFHWIWKCLRIRSIRQRLWLICFFITSTTTRWLIIERNWFRVDFDRNWATLRHHPRSITESTS